MATTCIFLPSTPNFSHSSSRSTSAVTRSSLTDQSQSPAAAAKRRLLSLISGQERGLKTQSNPQMLSQIVDAIDSLAAVGLGSVTTDESLSATWRMLWTTEKEQLFIIKNAPIFGSAAGDVLQVIDVEKKTLNNVITFPPDGVFFVRSDIQVASAQRVNFQFESLYIDDEIRVVKDIRKDYLVVERAPYSWKE
ncbi:probable plastid-lipid-associated protein 11, chloroplastic isoform X2 [Salvia miltiorrhiza]|uniref:probable plastid-lipid-associated protein 11, chloroplastic isoform X2 n=1 Tax=Salvia miltiorrhiza TaxID=226208 RepID=UPI0025AD03BE|nr:probable plastid-lipid-associated protein 11, chloroplastic isoform X2 [Salvia miltiorrhiza]XP_057807314.1 probable plastid-lipid-associated protein 11, chloroplastic isoform X2 [Salvia miltiorrhiza]XP_057807315.1 probable plastid-lipid-associated protein 11, chloroplastic isoform X2 [Salvia miltiorrhiza]